MSDRLRFVLMTAILLGMAYLVAKSTAPQYLTQPNELLAFVVALLVAAVLLRRRRGSAAEAPAKAPAISFAAPGRDYEDACKDTLRSLGWRIVHTPRTRDRGADVYAMKGHVKLLIQCKDYKGLVGYAAVSQVKAAEASYPADHLCVVAPCDFSGDAKRAARDIGVKLLHHDELRGYARSLA